MINIFRSPQTLVADAEDHRGSGHGCPIGPSPELSHRAIHLHTLLASSRKTLETPWQSVKSAWKAWTRLAHKIGNFQARVLLTLLYLTLVLPFGLCVRLFSDPLRIKRRPARWLDRTREACDMDWAHRQ